MKELFVAGMSAMIIVTASPAHAQGRFVLEEASIASIRQALKDGTISCRALVQAYLDRIEAYDQQGPKLHAIRALNPSALAEADAFDKDTARLSSAPLGCVPLVLKDNYNTAEMPTTGGSASLAGARPKAS
jgi:amidase